MNGGLRGSIKQPVVSMHYVQAQFVQERLSVKKIAPAHPTVGFMRSSQALADRKIYVGLRDSELQAV
ncbi:hypothetical protein HFO91_32890 [Rhizobium leguminosarum]|uniref:hypothetical protein n=1 Tax=Rhizobium leguminosarum TaxID=384 RepID=UPI001C97AEBB|nr:hypothetical protein [Rhizobium leguminosarum]MBY5454356.1 hypothetical protein [Rhizobium leguminosarum]